MHNLRILATLFVVGAAVSSTGCIISSDDDATLRVENRSNYDIVELHLTSVGSSSWGPNLLSGDALLPGESITLGVDCGFYDALLVDDTDTDCEVRDLDLCLNDADWIIRDNTCTVFAAAKAAREALKNASTPAAATK